MHRIAFGPASPAALALSPDGQTLGAADLGGTIRLFNVLGGKEVPRGVGLQTWVHATTLTPDGRTAATLAGGRAILLWDPTTGRERPRLEGHEDLVLSMHATDDGRTLFSSSLDKTLRVWDLRAGKWKWPTAANATAWRATEAESRRSPSPRTAGCSFRAAMTRRPSSGT